MHKSLQQGRGHTYWLTALLFFTVIFTLWPDNIGNNWTKVSNSILENVLSSGPEGVSNSLSISISSTFGNLRQVLQWQFWDTAPSQAAPSDPHACSCFIISGVCHFSDKCDRRRGTEEGMTADMGLREQQQVLVWPANANGKLSLHCLLRKWKYCHGRLIYGCSMEISL